MLISNKVLKELEEYSTTQSINKAKEIAKNNKIDLTKVKYDNENNF